jgi:hypothetical protein
MHILLPERNRGADRTRALPRHPHGIGWARGGDMAVTLTELEGGRVLQAQVSGKLAHADYEHLAPAFERLIGQHGKIRVLLDMVDFHGWEAAALWDDLKLDFKHFAHIERLAMVGDKAWEKGMSVFCKPFTTATVRSFDRAERDQAVAWITA